MSLSVDDWAAKILDGDVRAVSRAITAIENHATESEALLRQLFPHTGQAYLTGVTGAPGTGKSTSASWPSTPQALTPAAPFSATASACRATPATAAFSFAPWQPEVFSGASRVLRPKSLFSSMQPASIRS